MLGVLLQPKFANYFSAFDDNGPRFGHPLVETAMTELTIMLFSCFVQADE